MTDEPFPIIPFLEGTTSTEDDQRCPECGFLACICFRTTIAMKKTMPPTAA